MLITSGLFSHALSRANTSTTTLVTNIEGTNLNFASPSIQTNWTSYLVTTSSTPVSNNTTALTGWTINTSAYSGATISNGNGHPTSFNYSPISSVVPSNTQMVGFQFQNVGSIPAGQYNSTIAQNFTLSPGTYTVTFYIQARPTYFNSAQTVTCTLNGTSTNAYTFSSTGSWVSQSLTTVVASQGTYTLTFKSTLTSNGASYDTTVVLGGVSIARV